MTPLLPQPLPWPSGEALLWARDRHWEGVPALGSVAIQPVPHRVDEETLPAGLERWLPREGIPELLVRCRGSRLKPSWHAGNGLYGFVGLEPGDYTFTIEDPRGRFLPARFSLNVRNRSAVAEALQLLERPSGAEDWRLLVHRIALRPAAAGPVRPGATAISGIVRTSAGVPIPHALVQLDTRFRGVSATATTWSDASGGYALDLDGERADPMAPSRGVVERGGRLCLPRPSAAADPTPWIERMPVWDRALVESIRTGVAPAGYGAPGASGIHFWFRDGPSGTPSDRLRLTIGRHQRCDLELI